MTTPTEALAVATRMRAFPNCEGNIQYLRKLIYEDSAALVSMIPAVESAAGAGSQTTQDFYKAASICGTVGECSGNTGMWPLVAAGAAAVDAAMAAVDAGIAAVDAGAWEAAVIANGGTVSPARRTIVNRFISAEISAGTWNLSDDYWPLWSENAAQALTSLKQRRLATAVAAPTFTADRGYAFNATTSYLRTGFVPSTQKIAMAENNARIAVHIIADNASSGAYAVGCNSSGTRGLHIRPRTNTTSNSAAASSNSSTWTVPGSTTQGFTAISRSGPPTSSTMAFKNGVTMPNLTLPTTADLLPSHEIYIGALNNLGTVVFGSPPGNQVGFACVGASLTPAQEAAQYANVQAWAIAIGAAV